MQFTPFTVAVPDADIDDLRIRLEGTRWPAATTESWDRGQPVPFVRALAEQWRTYDWRKHERAMNAWPQFRTEIDGIPLHFMHVRGKGPNPKPLILSHGWPWTFWEHHKVVGPLSDPAAHGGGDQGKKLVLVLHPRRALGVAWIRRPLGMAQHLGAARP